MQRVADAIRKVTAVVQQQLSDGERPASIDLNDVIEVQIAIADELDAIAVESELPAAARALFKAREDQMVTSAEWDRLRKVVDAAS